jgi:hypothetical protein
LSAKILLRGSLAQLRTREDIVAMNVTDFTLGA